MIQVTINWTEDGTKGDHHTIILPLDYCERLTPTWARIAQQKATGSRTPPENCVVWEMPPFLVPGRYTGYRIYNRTERKLTRYIHHKEPTNGV